MKFAICNEIFQDWPLERVLRFAGAEGYDGVELAPFTVADTVCDVPATRREEIKAAAASSGVEIVGLHWLLAKPEGLHVSHPDESLRAKTQSYMDELIDFCADVGGDRMVIGSPRQRNVTSGLSFDQAWELAKHTFKSLLGHAADRGVALCIEPLARGVTDFINTVEEGKRMVDEIGHPYFKLHLDVLAMCNEGVPLDEIIRSARGYVGHVHVNDAGKGGPGSGQTDYEPIVRGLRDIGYDDYLSVEVFDFSPGPESIGKESLEFLKRVFS